ncbi:MAG: hypothetical protein NVS1B2_22710 [Vulcanimicrobiaceae bacterium]
MSVAVRVDPRERDAIEREVAAGALAIVGAAGTGKTTALVARARRLARSVPSAAVIVFAPGDPGVAHLRERCASPGIPVDTVPGAQPTVTSFGAFAFETLRALRSPADADLALIDDAVASQHFEAAGATLFALEWTEFVSDDLDPEITGLRSPERFSAAAFRLIRKLRGALISPERFRTACLQGATSFYGRPPNFAHPDLLLETPQKYRDSLRVSPAELERQYAREIDLAKILVRLYESYVETLVARGCLTAIDAVYEATMRLRAEPARANDLRARTPHALIDDAQDLTTGQIGFLEAIYGTTLDRVTFAGDAAAHTRGFATGARGGDVFALAATTISLGDTPARPPAIVRAARIGATLPVATDDRAASPGTTNAGATLPEPSPNVVVYRATSQRDETTFVASEAQRLVAAGTPPGEIAVVVRTLACAHGLIDALLARDVPVEIGGNASLYAYPAVLDALAVLWSVVDPFRHEYLLRVLEAPFLRLADATIATLCGDAAEPQALLFALPDDDVDEARAGRWDRRRDLRLGRNVTGGDVDLDLTPEAGERVRAFRAARERWVAATRTHALGEHARLVLEESILATGGTNARGRFERGLVDRLLADIDAFERRSPLASLGDYLVATERLARAEADLLRVEPRARDAVWVVDVETAKGRSFEAAFVVDLRAGAWPRYYVPDAFLFSPSIGMVPKDNVGDATAARTAKFTYAMYRQKFREKYNAEERRAFYVAATRARTRLYLSASGRPTRGVSAPELLAEIERTL